MPPFSIRLYYDIVSPYSFIAFTQLQAYQPLWKYSLTLHPVFQGAVMKGAANTPPGLVPAKSVHMQQRDLPALSRYYRLPIRIPSNYAHFMYNTLSTMRTLTALADASRMLWEYAWQRDEDILQQPVLTKALLEAGLTEPEITKLLELAVSPDVKLALRHNTEALLAAGGFGVPTLLIADEATGKEELLFGSDRMHVLAQSIGQHWTEPLPPEQWPNRQHNNSQQQQQHKAKL